MSDPRAPIFAAVRTARPGVFNDPVDGARRINALDNLLDAFGVPREGQTPAPAPAAAAFDDPAWVRAGRSKLGEREIPGPKHNPWITGFWQKLGAAWFRDDETPWCGGFMAWCLAEAGLPWPKNFPAAASFASWGTPCKPQVGAIMVKARKGGNHVGIIVGETPDKRFFKVLGGNQNNMVSIVDILKASATAIRWPKGAPAPGSRPLPVMPVGTVGASEA